MTYVGEKWPTHKQTEFWNSASSFVASRSGVPTSRSGMYMCIACMLLLNFTAANACRSVISRHLRKKFRSAKDAGKVYFGELQQVGMQQKM